MAETDRVIERDQTSLGCKLRTLHLVYLDRTESGDGVAPHDRLDPGEVRTDLDRKKSQLLSITA